MKFKFVDYEIEHKGFWNYGFRYWLTKGQVNKKGKLEFVIFLTTNDIQEAAEKIREFTSENIPVEFEQNKSFEQHKYILLEKASTL